MIDYIWRKTDPRHSNRDKHSNIIIVRPEPPVDEEPVCIATVETNHGYYIHTSFKEPYSSVSEGDDWPKDWQWTWAPKT